MMTSRQEADDVEDKSRTKRGSRKELMTLRKNGKQGRNDKKRGKLKIIHPASWLSR
jgi:hypothetical protein